MQRSLMQHSKSYQKVAQAEAAALKAEGVLSAVEGEVHSLPSVTSRHRSELRLSLVPKLIELAHEFHQAAQAWGPNESAPGQVAIQQLEIRSRQTLANLAESMGDYSLAESQFKQMAQISTVEGKGYLQQATQMRRRGRRRQWMLRSHHDPCGIGHQRRHLGSASQPASRHSRRKTGPCYPQRPNHGSSCHGTNSRHYC